MNSIITSFLQQIDTAAVTIVSTAYGSLAGSLAGVFRMILMFYVVWWGYLVLLGRTTAMPLEIVERIGRVIFIYTMATNWAAFSAVVYHVVTEMPDAIGSSIMSATGATPGQNGIATALNRLYDSGNLLVGKVYVGSYLDFIGAILAAVVLLSMLLFIGLVLAILVATKLLVAGVLSLAPIFIILAMFGYTFRFTDGYIRALIGLMVTMILTYAFLGVYAGILDKVISTVGDSSTTMAKIGIITPFIFVCLCGFLVIQQIPALSASIVGSGAGGVGIGLSAAAMVGRSARAAAPFLMKGAAVGGALGMQGGSWLMNPPGGGGGRSGGGGGGRAGGSTDSMRAAMAESLKRNGRPPVLQGEILPPMTPRPALTFRPQLPPPEHFNS